MDTWTVIIQMDMWTSRPNPSMSAIATNVSIKRETPRMELIKKKKTESEERTQLGTFKFNGHVIITSLDDRYKCSTLDNKIQQGTPVDSVHLK